MNRSAEISEDGLYRYRLDRWWGDGARVLWIMLNPSTADAEVDDPTIRRCIGFTKAWGYDGLTVVNMYPFRATKPADLRRWLRRGGDAVALNKNSDVTLKLRRAAPLVIAAWGANADFNPIDDFWTDVYHLGRTGGGQPRHPLFVLGDTKPIPWAAAPTTEEE